METGGLRADVNVSVRRADDLLAPLGTRVEIKNLSSLKAVEDAIMAERDRQIALLTAVRPSWPRQGASTGTRPSICEGRKALWTTAICQILT